MKLRAYDKDDNVIDVDALYFDGYLIGGRMLEGLVIKITKSPDFDDINVSADWPKRYNTVHWMAEAKRFALQHDVFSTSPDLDNDDGFIVT